MNNIEHKPLTEMLIAAYGAGVDSVFKTLPGELEIINQLDITFTLKDALVQCLFQEASGNCHKVAGIFRIKGDPVVYFRDTLMETPGLDKAREMFDAVWAEKVNKNPSEAAKEELRQQASIFNGSRRLRRFLTSY